MTPWNHSPRSAIARNLLVIGLSVLAAGPAHAVPSPVNSSCPPIALVAADGSCCFDVVVRDAANLPVAGATVVVDFDVCPVSFCPAQPPGLVVVGNTVRTTSDAAGLARFCICATVTLPCSARIYADGVLLCEVPVSNTCGPTPIRKAGWGRLKIIYR